MSIAYTGYITIHKDCVMIAAKWILNHIRSEQFNELFPDFNTAQLLENFRNHDESKYSVDEYAPYDNYFYGEQTDLVNKEFDYAWLHHIHNNPHHWQYWILKEDDSQGNDCRITVKCLEIPDVYIVEMIADWWSFSWQNYLVHYDKHDLYRIFKWYEDHTDKLAINPKSREKVDKLINLIHITLDNNVI